VVRDTALIGTKEICTWSWLLREPGSGTRRAFEKGLMAIGLDMRCLNVAVTVDSTEAVLQCVRAGLGVSVTSRLAAQTFLERGEIVEVKVPFLEMNRSFYTVYHPRRHFFPVFRYFLEFLNQERAPLVGGPPKTAVSG
jgi:DNA-binding transcriptional LysR family regulator